MRAAGLGPGMRVLEIGCGTGIFTQFFARTGAHIVALDLSPELLDKARRRCGAFVNIQFLVGRFEDYRSSDPFDAIVGSSVLHHLELKAALERIRGLLRPGGTAAFAEPNMLNPQIFLQKNVPWLKKRLGDTPEETAFFRWRLQRQLERQGFIDVKITPFDWLHPLTPLFLIQPISKAGELLERIAVLRELAGSLLIQARQPL